MGSEAEQKKAVPLYKERAFGDMVVAPFSFFSQELKGILTAVLKFAGPFFISAILVAIFFFNDFVETFQFTGGSHSPMQFKFSFLIIYILFIMAFFVINITIYHYISAYNKYGKGNFSLKNVSEGMLQSGLKIFAASLLITILIIPILILFAFIPFIGTFLIIVLFFVIFVYLSLFPFVIAVEKSNIFESFKISINLIKNNWWFTFGLYLLYSAMLLMSTYITMIPMVLVGAISVFTGQADGKSLFVLIGLFGILIFILYIVQIIILNIMYGVHYFNLKAKQNPNTELLKTQEEVINRFENQNETNRFIN
jgi:hypothetical protein